jgi:transposase
VLSVEDWAEIRRLHRSEGMAIKAIARVMGVSRNTVKAALRSEGPPRYGRPLRGSLVDEVEPRIRELLQAVPTMPATVIAERIGWQHSIRILRDRVAELRPVYLPPDPASRTTYEAGDVAQCDLWFPPVELPVGFGQTRAATELPVLTMVTGYSRWLSAVLIPTRRAEDLFAGWWQLITGLSGVPRTLVWDGESAIGRWRGGRVELTGDCQAFRGTLGTKVIVLRPADPEAKGIIERAHDYLETSFLPGRSFASPADFNAQLRAWLAVANSRRKRVLGCAPSERIGADRAAMLTLPPVPPQTGWRASTRLPRDHYVRLDGNDYSVHPAAIGRRVEVLADLDQVRVVSEGRLVAEHERIWAKHQTLTDPGHAAAAKALRIQHRTRLDRGLHAVPAPPAHGVRTELTGQSGQRGTGRAGAVEVDVPVRALSDYDHALGVDLPDVPGIELDELDRLDQAVVDGGVA